MKHTPYLSPPPRPASSLWGRFGLGQPDIRRNPCFWPLGWTYGHSILSTILEVAGRGERIADLGCASGWLSLEIARRHQHVHVLAVDRNQALLEWGQGYQELRKRHDKHGRYGHVDFESGELKDLELTPGSLDVAIVSFCLGGVKDSLQVLDEVHRALRPGGILVYYDAAEPTPFNLDRLSGWIHRRARWRGEMSDLWNQHRKLEDAYRKDAVRRRRHPGAPAELEVFHHIQEVFEVYEHIRCRAFIDLYLEGLSPRWSWLSIPTTKAVDNLCVRMGWLEGCCRFVLARRR